MNTVEITTQPRLIAIGKLAKSSLNARRAVAKMGMNELKASILSHGLMQNLVVTDAGDGSFRVIAGGRRLDAICSLQAGGKLPDDFAVPCQVVSEDHALEMSLAENTVRLAMHPADQFEAFAALIDQGATSAAVAQRFGVEESLVQKRMKLARVAPQLLKEYRSDGMTLECLMAFTVTDDHRRQVKVFKSLQDWQNDDPSAIRAALTEKFIEAGSKLARFVGLDAYVAAGGATRADLFGDEVYLEKPALLNKLAEQKLEAIRKEMEAEGWGWIEINPERDWQFVNRCERIKPLLVDAPSELIELKSQLDAEYEAMLQALAASESDALPEEGRSMRHKLDEVEEKLTAYVGFDAEQKKLAGCYVSIDNDGAAFLDKGLVKPEQRKALAKLLGTDDGKSAVAKPKNALSESLRRSLAAFRLPAAQVEIARHPAIAFDLLTFQAASRLLDSRPLSDGAQIEFRIHKGNAGSETETNSATEAFAAVGKSLSAGWRKPRCETARFEAFRLLPQAEKLRILAYCVAMTLAPKLAPASVDEATAYDFALDLTGGDMSGYWRPGKEIFLARVSRDQLLAIARATLGDAWADSRRNDKKASLVEQLDRAFADPAKYGRTAEQVEKLRHWLPADMALSLYLHSQPGTKKKAKKAA